VLPVCRQVGTSSMPARGFIKGIVTHGSGRIKIGGFTPEYQPADSTAFKSHPQQLTHLQRGSQLMEPGQGALCWLGCPARHPSHATLGDREPLPAAAEPPQRLHIVTLVPAQWGCCAGSSATTCNC
jgi:hypothetical protein